MKTDARKYLPFLFLTMLYACSSNPKSLIVNKWKATGAYGDTKQQERYKQRFSRNSTEIEFTKDGKFFAYRNGELEGSASYDMAPDGKSLAVNADGDGFTMRIVHLSSDKLEVVSRGFMSSKDTIIYERSK